MNNLSKEFTVIVLVNKDGMNQERQWDLTVGRNDTLWSVCSNKAYEWGYELLDIIEIF